MGYIFTEQDDKFIYDNYETLTMKEIANRLGLTDSQVRHRIQRHLNIKPSKRKKHYHNEEWFKEDSENKFYILGLISADGNLFNDGYKNKYKVSIALHRDDIDLLKDINSLICDTNLVSTRKNTSMSELVLYNETIYNEIKKYNINENKSLTLEFPTNIPDKYLKDFIRGNLDGDGCISVDDKTYKTYEKLTVRFYGTEKFLEGLNEVLDNKFNTGIKKVSKTKGNLYCLRYFTKQAREIMNWLYSNNALKLERKYEKFDNYRSKLND